MKYEWLDGMDDQYLEEAMTYEKVSHKKRWFRPALIAAAVLVLLVSAALVVMMTRQRSASEDSPLMYPATPVSVYLSGENQTGAYTTMNVNQAVTIDSTYVPEGSQRWEGIGFRLSLEGYRLDATADNGYFLEDLWHNSGQSYESSIHILSSQGEGNFFTFNYDSLSFIWRPYGTADFWGQEANIRLYAVKENVVYMYAVVHIAAPNQHCFTAELVHYENFTEQGGCAITEENRDYFYPNGTTPAKTCDIHDVRSGQTPQYLPLNVLQPISMKIELYDEEKHIYYWNTHDFRRLLPYAIPFVAEVPEREIVLHNSQAILCPPDAGLTEEEMEQYALDKGFYYLLNHKPKADPIRAIDTTQDYFSDADGTAYGLLLPWMPNSADEGSFSQKDMTLEIAGYNESHEYIVYALALVSTYWVPHNDVYESIIVVRHYEDYTDIGGISVDSVIYQNFGKPPLADRIQNIQNIVPEYSDEELETVIALGAKMTETHSGKTQDDYEKYFNPPTVESLREYYSREPSVEVIKDLLDRYPFASDEAIAKACRFWISYPGCASFLFDRDTDFSIYPHLTAQILGIISEDTPRMSPEQALTIIENTRQTMKDSNNEMDTEEYMQLTADMITALNTASGGADKRLKPDPRINSIRYHDCYFIYQLSDGSILKAVGEYQGYYIERTQPDTGEVTLVLRVSTESKDRKKLLKVS